MSGGGLAIARRALVVGLSLRLLVAAPVASAGGIRDLEDGWLVPPPDVRSLLSLAATRGPSTSVALPVAQPSGGWLVLGQARLFGMPELPLYVLAAGVAARRWSLGGSWQRLGGDLWREDRGRLRLLLGRGRRWGLIGGLDSTSWTGGSSARAPYLAAAIEHPVPWGVLLRASWSVLPPPSWHGDRGRQRQALLTGGWAWGRWALACDADGKGAPTVQAEALLSLGPRAAFGLRGDPATGALGFSTWWIAGGVLLRSSHLVHPELGITHRWGLVLGRADVAP